MLIRGSSTCTAMNSILMDGEVIEMVQEFKYLGVLIDNRLTFKANVDYVCKKVSKKVGVLSRLAKFITLDARINIYKSIIAPHFDYCATILYLCDETSFIRMQRLQNRAMRSILMCKKLTPVRVMLESLNLLNVKQRVHATTLKFIHKLKFGVLPSYLSEMVTFNSDVHNFPTRSKNNFWFTCKRSAKARNSVFHKGLIEFNSLPSEVKNERSGGVFNRKLRSYLKDVSINL